jgi:hypothetical protein
LNIKKNVRKPTENKSTLPEVSPQDNQQPPGTRYLAPEFCVDQKGKIQKVNILQLSAKKNF